MIRLTHLTQKMDRYLSLTSRWSFLPGRYYTRWEACIAENLPWLRVTAITDTRDPDANIESIFVELYIRYRGEEVGAIMAREIVGQDKIAAFCTSLESLDILRENLYRAYTSFHNKLFDTIT